jgi:nucleoid DNA-binding protein
MQPHIRKSEYKEKLGTVLSKDLIEKIKDKSKRENRSISDIIEVALTKYIDESDEEIRIRLEAFNQFTSNKTSLSAQEIDEILNEDYFDQ